MMQLLTVVYRYGDDAYYLAADGEFIDCYRNRKDAEDAAAAIRMLNLSGYRVTGENPDKRTGEPFGRIFLTAAIGPQLPNPYALREDGPAPRHHTGDLIAMDAPRDVMRRALDFLTMPYALIAELRQLDPEDRGLLYSAVRYSSADELRLMILAAQDGKPRYVHPDNLASWVSTIAYLCREDGAEVGFIPLITGPIRAVWEALYAWFCARESRDRQFAPLHRSIGGY